MIKRDNTYNNPIIIIETLYSEKFRSALKFVMNPHGEGNATSKILEVLKNNPIPEEIKKEFYDL